jgi:hypothetical protein
MSREPLCWQVFEPCISLVYGHLSLPYLCAYHICTHIRRSLKLLSNFRLSSSEKAGNGLCSYCDNLNLYFREATKDNPAENYN